MLCLLLFSQFVHIYLFAHFTDLLKCDPRPLVFSFLFFFILIRFQSSLISLRYRMIMSPTRCDGTRETIYSYMKIDLHQQSSQRNYATVIHEGPFEKEGGSSYRLFSSAIARMRTVNNSWRPRPSLVKNFRHFVRWPNCKFQSISNHPVWRIATL